MSIRSHFTTPAAKALAGTAFALLASASAFAQSTVLVVDTAKVYNDSTVGKHIERQISTMANTTKTQLEAKQSPLQTRGKSLMTQMDGKTREQIAANTTLVSQIQKQQKDEMQLQQDAAIAQREIQMAKLKAVQLVDAKVSSIIKTLVSERKADIVIDRANVIYGAPADITPDVLSRLNAQMTTVPVTREKLPAPTR
ncbi:OmpH family outer membrane protein [uncultured Algimonas sp.]|uniref:OmpH family outer membrane protein n=1 Tax=uncultured Algimonas sp. TaxID=1547920 RepID=UPI00262F360F|nr:OmpH family outer membrane protein [uncultured Algimonas sp.]